jgi:hypothetical protein
MPPIKRFENPHSSPNTPILVFGRKFVVCTAYYLYCRGIVYFPHASLQEVFPEEKIPLSPLHGTVATLYKNRLLWPN